MSTSLLSLDPTLHCSVKHRWQLAAQTTVQVSGIHDIAQATSNLQQLEALTSREIWTRRGPGLRIEIQILVDGDTLTDASGAAQLLETIGPILRDAEAGCSHTVALEILIRSAMVATPPLGNSISTDR